MALHELINTHLDSMSPRPQQILDVGGGAQPHSAATEILDLFDYNFAQRFSYDRDRSRVDGQKWTTFVMYVLAKCGPTETTSLTSVSAPIPWKTSKTLSGFVTNWHVYLGLDTLSSRPAFKRALMDWLGAASLVGHITAGW